MDHDPTATTGSSRVPRIMELAERLEADIRQKKLVPGDPYLPLAEAARMLGVSWATANRALQLLAKRGIIQRVQRRGAFIGALQREPSPGRLSRVLMVVQRQYLRQEGSDVDRVLVGIQSVLPGADVHFNFLPVTDPTEYMNGLIGDVLRSKEPAGLVLNKVPFVVQRAVKDSGLPAVVHGSLYPSVENLPWIDQDNAAIARIVARYVERHRCAHLCALTREIMYPGDNIILNELTRLLGRAGRRADDFSICHLPDDAEAVAAETERVIHRHPLDLCLLCRSEIKVDGATRCLERLGLKGRRRPRLIVSVHMQRPSGDYPHPYIFPTMSPEEMGAATGRLLVAQVTDPMRPAECRTIPVELVDATPDGAESLRRRHGGRGSRAGTADEQTD